METILDFKIKGFKNISKSAYPFECFFIVKSKKPKEEITNIEKECVFLSDLNVDFNGKFDKAIAFSEYRTVIDEYIRISKNNKDFKDNKYYLYICKYYLEQDRIYFYEKTNLDILLEKMESILPESIFIENIENITKQNEKTERFGKVLSEFCSGNFVFDTNNFYYSSLVKTMDYVLTGKNRDKYEDNTVEWYLYENLKVKDKKYYFNEKAVIVTPHLLYQLLVMERTSKNICEMINLPEDDSIKDELNNIFFERYGIVVS